MKLVMEQSHTRINTYPSQMVQAYGLAAWLISPQPVRNFSSLHLICQVLQNSKNALLLRGKKNVDKQCCGFSHVAPNQCEFPFCDSQINYKHKVQTIIMVPLLVPLSASFCWKTSLVLPPTAQEFLGFCYEPCRHEMEKSFPLMDHDFIVHGLQ